MTKSASYEIEDFGFPLTFNVKQDGAECAWSKEAEESIEDEAMCLMQSSILPKQLFPSLQPHPTQPFDNDNQQHQIISQPCPEPPLWILYWAK